MDTLLSELPKTRSEAKEIGSMYYFTNKPCKNGHTSKRLVSNKHCYECDLGHSKNYHESNKEAIKDYKKSYRESNREAIREQQKAYRESNRESIREHMKSYYESNREAIRERNKSYYATKVGKSPDELGTRRTPDPARYVYFLVVKDSETNEKLFL